MFRIGDRVLYSPKNHRATVIRVLPNDEYKVEFEDKQLIPPQMDVPGRYLLYEGSDALYEWAAHSSRGNKETHCPRCGNKWTETIIGRNTFYDCLKCNLKREDS